MSTPTPTSSHRAAAAAEEEDFVVVDTASVPTVEEAARMTRERNSNVSAGRSGTPRQSQQQDDRRPPSAGHGTRTTTPTPPTLSVAALRRSSPMINTPTRTLRLSEQEQQVRETTPIRAEDILSRRPRSNPRRQTPVRNESPLDPDVFRPQAAAAATTSTAAGAVVSDTEENHNPQQPQEQQPRHRPTASTTRETRTQPRTVVVAAEPAVGPRRITIRPLAGSAVGTTISHRVLEEGPSDAAGKSHKQGPSHRKVRRWNNDHFGNLAAEIASQSSMAAHVLLQAQATAHLYRSIYDPKEHKSETLERFMKEANLQDVRERFFEGEFPLAKTHVSVLVHSSKKPALTGEAMLLRIESRLRRVVIRACSNSYPACQVVSSFETFLLSSFVHVSSKKSHTTAVVSQEEGWWQDLLLEQPTLTDRTDGKRTAQFYFDPESSKGGFHRLLLHAVCQFHGFMAVSRMVNIDGISSTGQARALTVTSELLDRHCLDATCRLVPVIESMGL